MVVMVLLNAILLHLLPPLACKLNHNFSTILKLYNITSWVCTMFLLLLHGGCDGASPKPLDGGESWCTGQILGLMIDLCPQNE